MLQQQRVIGSIVGTQADMLELLQLASSRGIRPPTQMYTLEDANAAHEQVLANQVRYRAVLTPARA